jgi:hypothetical protein
MALGSSGVPLASTYKIAPASNRLQKNLYGGGYNEVMDYRCNTLILLKFWLYKNLLATIYMPKEYKVVLFIVGIQNFSKIKLIKYRIYLWHSCWCIIFWLPGIQIQNLNSICLVPFS